MDATSRINASGKFAATFCLVLGLTQLSWGQNVYKDYVIDRHAQYSPFDHQQRGLVYRVHTGHAGLFGNCDDDRQKMISPYIDWHCRTPNRSLVANFTSELFTDIFRKSQRFADGAGACIIGKCNQCQQSPGDCNCQQLANQSENQQMADRRGFSEQRISPRAKRTIDYAKLPPKLYDRSQQGNQSNSRRQTNLESAERSASTFSQTATAYSARGRAAGGGNIQEATNRSDSRPKHSGSGLTPSSFYTGIDQHSSRQAWQHDLRGKAKENTGQPVARTAERTSSRQVNQSVDPRYSDSSNLTPTNKFEAIEKAVNQKRNHTQNQPSFQLSNGGVYTRPTSKLRSNTTPSEPVQDQKFGPQYFQFQQIGGSRNR